MKTYKFVMLNVYETELEYTAESLEEAKEMLHQDDLKYEREMRQNNSSESFYVIDESQKEIDLKYTISGVTPI